nr:hypothetical protein CFP56_07767 [Quercus suber]
MEATGRVKPPPRQPQCPRAPISRHPFRRHVETRGKHESRRGIGRDTLCIRVICRQAMMYRYSPDQDPSQSRPWQTPLHHGDANNKQNRPYAADAPMMLRRPTSHIHESGRPKAP